MALYKGMSKLGDIIIFPCVNWKRRKKQKRTVCHTNDRVYFQGSNSPLESISYVFHHKNVLIHFFKSCSNYVKYLSNYSLQNRQKVRLWFLYCYLLLLRSPNCLPTCLLFMTTYWKLPNHNDRFCCSDSEESNTDKMTEAEVSDVCVTPSVSFPMQIFKLILQ